MPSYAADDGTHLAYRLMGDGPLLLCLPGGPGEAAGYLGDLGGLSTTRTLVLPDRAGHFPWVEDPAGFAGAVENFLAD